MRKFGSVSELVKVTVVGLFMLITMAVVVHSHNAPHGGSLSVIERCSTGHIETIVEGDTIKLWFLDGGESTDRSIRITERSIPLSVITPNGERFEMNLFSEPLKLAGETVGNASHFVGKLSVLANLESFEAFGWAKFKGKMRPIHIVHPQGYDPDHDFAGHVHDETCGLDHTNCGH